MIARSKKILRLTDIGKLNLKVLLLVPHFFLGLEGRPFRFFYMVRSLKWHCNIFDRSIEEI